MEYSEALDKIHHKLRDNFIVVTVAYDLKLVFPYDEGIRLIEALKHAEQFDKSYDPTHIHSFDRNNIAFSVLSAIEYEQYKLVTLLNITLDEAKKLHPIKPEKKE